MADFAFGFLIGLCLTFIGWAFIANNMQHTYLAILLAIVCLLILLIMGIKQ